MNSSNQPEAYNNGILPVQNNAQMDAARAKSDKKLAATKANNEPLITNLAAHVKSAWESAYQAKIDVEQDMLKALRQRRGEYDPEILAEIKKSNGSEIYMMVTSNKCRAATSWLRDTLLGAASDKPWTIAPTAIPELSPEDESLASEIAVQEALEIEQTLGIQNISKEQAKEHIARVKDKIRAKAKEKAAADAVRMEEKMEDQLQEGNFITELSKFLDDITTFRAAIFKGPVIRNKPSLQWAKQVDGTYTAEVKNKIVTEWERVDPFNIYPAAEASSVNDGDMIERHRMTRNQLYELIGVEGYSEDAIRGALADYGRNGLYNWLRSDAEKASAEGKNTLSAMQNTGGLIDALQFFGSIQGKMLVEWGLPKEQVPDMEKEYPCEVWQIGTWTIKASLNYDPFGRKPYYKASYEEIPGSFWGNSVTDLVRDCSEVCNYAARSLVNNIGIASGPQVYVNVDRVAAGHDITEQYPWKIWPTVSDPYGSNTPPVEFFQPNSMANELMGIFERFSVMADEFSGVPRYMTGDASSGGAGRTASGLSMLMGNAGKAIKSVIYNIDKNVIAPVIERQYIHNMRYETDPELKGDIMIVAKGAEGMMQREQAQVRRNEFLNIVGQNQVFSQIVGPNGIAALLREAAKTLGMDVDKIVPSEEMIRVSQAQMQMQQMQQQNMQQGGGTMADTSNQNLQNGAPATNNFTPQKG